MLNLSLCGFGAPYQFITLVCTFHNYSLLLLHSEVLSLICDMYGDRVLLVVCDLLYLKHHVLFVLTGTWHFIHDLMEILASPAFCIAQLLHDCLQ